MKLWLICQVKSTILRDSTDFRVQIQIRNRRSSKTILIQQYLNNFYKSKNNKKFVAHINELSYTPTWANYLPANLVNCVDQGSATSASGPPSTFTQPVQFYVYMAQDLFYIKIYQ